MFQQLLNKVVEMKHLSREESREAMGLIMSGEVPPSQLASFLTALKIKGETVEEITGFALTMREKALKVEVPSDNLIDTCGTGGDGGKTFNISTASAFVAAAGGARVAKHGNRAVSSKSGSADVLEKLGVSIQLSEDEAKRCLERTNLCFMFAPFYHQAMKHAVATRKEIGFRTVFNLLGPLTNPAQADRQLIGVYDGRLAEKVAHVLRELGLVRCLIVAGEDGLDEISVSAATKVVELKNGDIHSYHIRPEDLGLRSYAISEVSGGKAVENASIIHRVFSGEQGADRDIVLANSAASLYLSEQASSIQEGVKLAAEIIDQGLALEKLNQLVQVTRGLSRAS
ncbi:anthranilate phosphoribosyltransferase [Ammoniphilus sp. CFH 90114]|uniref:anthranilate phosphoribosyltransferase n=1 Tax=Ammoniphilus sp. CFH 90114 TaxID=2493665 RepID=UPI00100FF6B5|nr:anthranilate phosphoribosyltransferase [Ammoniphilus sp. CFH 90114]RXT13913.1 anthranilate phosphoribosyltransferase [Ammoniphilus sp. CFH 90114]